MSFVSYEWPDGLNSNLVLHSNFMQTGSVTQSCKSGRAFRVGFGLKIDKNSGLIRVWDVVFVLGAQKYNQNNLAKTLTVFRPHLTFTFFQAWFGLQISLRVGAGFGLIFSGSWSSRPVYNSAVTNSLNLAAGSFKPKIHDIYANNF